jgi:hypothetical protein
MQPSKNIIVNGTNGIKYDMFVSPASNRTNGRIEANPMTVKIMPIDFLKTGFFIEKITPIIGGTINNKIR